MTAPFPQVTTAHVHELFVRLVERGMGTPAAIAECRRQVAALKADIHENFWRYLAEAYA